MAGDTDVLLDERRGPALVLTVNRPAKLNAISSAVLEALDRRLGQAEGDAEVRALVNNAAVAIGGSAGDLPRRTGPGSWR